MLVDAENAPPLSYRESDEEVNRSQQEEITNESLLDQAVDECESIAVCYLELIKQVSLLERSLETRYDQSDESKAIQRFIVKRVEIKKY